MWGDVGSNPTQGEFSFKHLFSIYIYIYIYIYKQCTNGLPDDALPVRGLTGYNVSMRKCT